MSYAKKKNDTKASSVTSAEKVGSVPLVAASLINRSKLKRALGPVDTSASEGQRPPTSASDNEISPRKQEPLAQAPESWLPAIGTSIVRSKNQPEKLVFRFLVFPNVGSAIIPVDAIMSFLSSPMISIN
jgi:hypothetical protein